MWRLRNPFDAHIFSLFFLTTLTVVLYEEGTASVVVPSTGCYVLDNSSHIYDFSKWIGYPFEYEGKDTDFAVRFCKDVESRSQPGYIDFGRFDSFNYFVAGSGRYDFVQEFYDGDLMNCERSYDNLGRTAQVNIICGDCPNVQCRGEPCIYGGFKFQDSRNLEITHCIKCRILMHSI